MLSVFWLSCTYIIFFWLMLVLIRLRIPKELRYALPQPLHGTTCAVVANPWQGRAMVTHPPRVFQPLTRARTRLASFDTHRKIGYWDLRPPVIDSNVNFDSISQTNNTFFWFSHCFALSATAGVTSLHYAAGPATSVWGSQRSPRCIRVHLPYLMLLMLIQLLN